MLDSLVISLLYLLTSPTLLALIFAAAICGIFFGIIPGLGGKLAIVLFIPVVMGMDPAIGLIFLVAMHAVVHTAGSIPSILFGIPGTGPDAATVVDGYPLTVKGQAGRALGASLSASAIGGIIGAIFLLVMLPVIEPIILAFSPAEFFLLAILGISIISATSGNSLRKGVILGCFGLCLSFVGLAPQTGEPRYSFGQLFLWDGIDFITVALAIFALPEMIMLDRKVSAPHLSSKASPKYQFQDVLKGMGDLVKHRWLALRTSLIGAIVGAIPGLGGDVASWFCYGHAVQSSKTPERFGSGAIEGVIAPETANNSKEGGALLPTLFFGVPGSSGMAVLLGAFVVLGIQPGPQLMLAEPTLVTSLIVTLVLANIFAVVFLLLCMRWIAPIAYLPAGVIVPVVMCLIVLGSYLSALNWQVFMILLVLGALGCAMKRYGWPRPPLLIGLALGPIAETSLMHSLSLWGLSFLTRPISMVLLGLIVLSIALYYRRLRKTSKQI